MRHLSPTLPAVLAALLAVVGVAHADEPKEHTAEYVEYRSLPELGQIQISSGLVRGEAAVKRLNENPDELAKRGIFPCTDKAKRHTYHRSETMAGHLVETTLTIDPPPEKKAGDADTDEPTWNRHVVVRIDGRKKFNCSIGDSPTDELTVYGLSIYPEDGTVDAAASDLDGAELVLPEKSLKIDSPDVITDDSFEEVDPGDDAPDEKPAAPVKVMFPGEAPAVAPLLPPAFEDRA